MLSWLLAWRKTKQKRARVERALAFSVVGSDNLFEDSFQFESYMPLEPGRTYMILGDGNILSGAMVFEGPKGQIRVGDRCYIGPGCRMICSSTIEIEDDVTIAWGVTIYDSDSHSLDPAERHLDYEMYVGNVRNGRGVVEGKRWEQVKTKPIKVCKDAWIGMNATVLKGVTIGQGAVVGACSVVTKDVEPWTVVAGNPARVVKRLK